MLTLVSSKIHDQSSAMHFLLITGILTVFLMGFSSESAASIQNVNHQDTRQANVHINGKLAEKDEDESLTDYCIRYFARLPFEDEQFYVARVFHKYENEDENGYLLRIRTVVEVFNSFNGWYNLKYLDSTKQYFILEYQQQEGESLEAYYKRILSKRANESFDLYRSRIKVLIKLFPILDCWQSYKIDHSKINGYTLQGKQLSEKYGKPEVAISGGKNAVSSQFVSELKGETENSELPINKNRTIKNSEAQLNANSKLEAAVKTKASATRKTADELTKLYRNLESDSELGVDAQNSIDNATHQEQTETNSKARAKAYSETTTDNTNSKAHSKSKAYSETMTDNTNSNTQSTAEAESDTTTDNINSKAHSVTEAESETTTDNTNSKSYSTAEAESKTTTDYTMQSGYNTTKPHEVLGAEAEAGATNVAYDNENSETAVNGTAKQANKYSKTGEISRSAITNSQMAAKGSELEENVAAGSNAASMSKTTTDSNLGMSVTTVEGNSNTLEEKKHGETDECYCKRIFSQRCGENEKSYVKRVFNKYDDETKEQYIYRLDVIISVVQSKSFYNYKYKSHTQYYMAVKYKRQETESESRYLQRILTKKQEESFQIYTLRIGYLRKFIPNLNCWSTFKFDKSSKRGYTLNTQKATNRYSPHVMRHR